VPPACLAVLTAPRGSPIFDPIMDLTRPSLRLFLTSEQGTVEFITDGKTLEVKTDR
jgi:hypothetical protein